MRPVRKSRSAELEDRFEKVVTEMNESEALAAFSRSSIAMVLSNPRLEDNPLVYVNQAFEKLTGYTASLAIGNNCRFLQGEETKESDVRKLREAIAEGRDISLVIDNHRADGSAFRNAVVITPLKDENDEIEFFLGIQRSLGEGDQDDFKRIEGLLTEIQHRVKNHLSMVVSMIRMQAREKSAEGDFDALSRRVESLQLLYEEMNAAQENTNKDVINVGAYLARVANSIAHIDGRAGVRVNVDTEPMEAETDKAVKIGLIVSELLTNALKHGFEGREAGLVEIKAQRLSVDGIRIIVSDDGVGKTDTNTSGGLGMKIIDGLVDSVGGGLSYSESEIGTVAVLDVPKRVAEPQADL